MDATEVLATFQIGDRQCQLERYFGRSYHVTHRFHGGIEWLNHDGVFRQLPLPLLARDGYSIDRFCEFSSWDSRGAVEEFVRGLTN